jgi:hypothetical protein
VLAGVVEPEGDDLAVVVLVVVVLGFDVGGGVPAAAGDPFLLRTLPGGVLCPLLPL